MLKIGMLKIQLHIIQFINPIFKSKIRNSELEKKFI